MEVQCKTFQLEGDPSELDDLASELSGLQDPAQQEALYRQAGFDLLAENVAPMRKADAAARRYVELSRADHRLYADYLSRRVDPKDCKLPPPPQAMTVAIGANKSMLFTGTTVLTHPVTGEALMLAYVDGPLGTRWFMLAHWGETLTTVEELRSRRRFLRTLTAQFRKIAAWHPKTSLIPADWSDKVPYLMSLTLAAALGWGTWFLFGSWWAYALVMVPGMILAAVHVSDASFGAGIKVFVGWMVALNLVAVVVIGGFRLNTWNTEPHTFNVLVCDTSQNPTTDDWRIVTSKGVMTLTPGFYNGTYYRQPTNELAKSFVGNWVRVTGHGHLTNGGGTTPYITEATTLNPGSCG